MIRLNVFFAYQFSNAQFSKIKRERAYSDALDTVNDELRSSGAGLSLHWDYWDISSGEALSEEIFSRMDRSDLFVFDLSDANSNVFIELGFAISQVRNSGKKMIVFVHDEVGRRSLPSDISGMFVHSVNESKLGRVLASELVSKASSIIPASRLVREFWNPSYVDLDIVCPVLPENRRSRHADNLEANYLKYLSYADLDTLFYIQEKSRHHFPLCRTANFRSDKYQDSSSTSSLVVGGPVWNEVAKNIQAALPLRFIDGGDGNDDPIAEYVDGKEILHSPLLVEGVLECDVSYLARVDMHDGSHTFLISGCRTYGVLGAAKAFFEPSTASANIQFIESWCGSSDFVIAFYTRVINNRVIPTKLDEKNIKSMYFRGGDGIFRKENSL